MLRRAPRVNWPAAVFRDGTPAPVDQTRTAMDGLSPFGGVKQSGIGRNFGHDGVRQFQETHSISGQSGQIFRGMQVSDR